MVWPRWRLLTCLAGGLGVASAICFAAVDGQAVDTGAAVTTVGRPPHLDPDYAETTIPPNVAPLNFTVHEPGTGYRVFLEGPDDTHVRVVSDHPGIRIPPDAWRELLRAARGDSIHVQVQVRRADGRWIRFSSVGMQVEVAAIDPVLVYRRFNTLYSKYVRMGIYERDLESYVEVPVLHNRSAAGACLNCHAFRCGDPADFVLQTRGGHGLTMLLARGASVRSVKTRTEFNKSPAAYTAWHPSGDYLAFSVNKVSLFYHTVGETRDVFDSASDLMLFRTADNVMSTVVEIARPDSLETWPNWSPDGRYLYFSRAPALPMERFAEVRYDLMRVPFDAQTGTWGRVETVLPASALGRSINQPQVSPDGRFLVVTLCAYGSFPVYLSSSDLHIIDLRSGRHHPLECNSARTDSWHTWSSNSRWLVFSSKRRDGLLARPFVTYVDTAGHARKPFVIPQDDPAFYTACIETFNVPTLARGQVQARPRQLGAVVRNTRAIVPGRWDPKVRSFSMQTPVEVPEPYSGVMP